MIKQEKKIVDYDGLYNELDGIAARNLNISGGGGWWSQQEKSNLISSISAILLRYTADRGEGDPMYYSYANELETILKQSFTENSQYDFKQGIHILKTGERNDLLLQKIFKTLTMMANTDKGATGYILIGVADNFEDAEAIRKCYNTENIKVGSFYVTGVNGEINKYYANADAYLTTIKNTLSHMPISEHYKRQIASKMWMVNYHEKAVVILRIYCDNGAVMFDNNYYTRAGSGNDPIPVSQKKCRPLLLNLSKLVKDGL